MGRMDSRTYEEELSRNGMVAFPVKGVSMRPLIKAGRDAVLVETKGGRLSRYDVGLFKRDAGDYVLHRVLAVGEDDYLFCGDGQTFTEAVYEDQVIGVMTGLTRKGKKVDLAGLGYRTYVALWCGLFPARKALLKVLHRMGIWVPAER